MFMNHFPNWWKKFLGYLISLSGALAMLNVVPCYWLDGCHILRALVDYFLERFSHSMINERKKKAIESVLPYVYIFFSGLLIANLGFSMLTLFI